MSRVKVQRHKYFDSKPRALCKSESSHSFSNSTMSEAKKTIIREDESEGDDTENLYMGQFSKNRGNLSFCRVATFLSTEFCLFPEFRIKTKYRRRLGACDYC